MMVNLEGLNITLFERERSFVRRCIAGDDDCWTTMFNVYLPPLKFKLRYWVLESGGCYADIEDIFSEFTLKVFKDNIQNLHDFLDSDKELSAWLYNGLRFQFKAWLTEDRRRQERLSKMQILLQLDNNTDACLDLLPDILDQFIITLPENEQEYMRLSFYDQLEDKEIAERTDLTYEGVRTRKFRIRRKFKTFMEKCLVY